VENLSWGCKQETRVFLGLETHQIRVLARNPGKGSYLRMVY